jgi:putative ABC transport system permease protein
MDVFLGLTMNVLEEGMMYGIMAMGVYITYKVLDFPDLSVDGTFPLGACVTASLILSGVDPWLACVLAFLAGMLAGSVTGLLNVKLKITNLLSGILVMTALWSVNLVITNGSAVVPFYDEKTIFTSGIALLVPDAAFDYRVLIVIFVAMAAVKILLDMYLKTKSGLLLRAAGNNHQFVTSLAIDPGRMKILGLAIGNGCTALAGSILAQQSESANISSGLGMVVMGLASVIIGLAIFRKVKFMRPTTMVVLGAVFYKACLVVAMQLGLPTNYMKILMAGIFVVALVSNRFFVKGRQAADG